MIAVVLLAFILVPLAEIAVFIVVGGWFGLWPTLFLVVATAVAGTFLLRQQGISTLRRAQASMARHELPVRELFDGLCLLAAGALLLTPGVLTDAVGALLLVPPFRNFIRGPLLRRLFRDAQWQTGPRPAAPENRGGPTIDGDYDDLTPPGRD